MAEDYVQNLDIYKYGRIEEMQAFAFETTGDVELIEDTPETEMGLQNLGEELRRKRLLPSLTLFYGRSSAAYKKEVEQFMIYCMKEMRKYKEIETQRDQNREMFIETMGSLNFENEFNLQLPDMSQFSQVVNMTGTNIFDQEGYLGFDQPIDDQGHMKYEGPLLDELNETLRQGNTAAEELVHREAAFQMSEGGRYAPMDYGNYEDYGDVETSMRRNPEDYVTPTNIFMRAARQLNTVKSNMKVYNMKRDLKQTNFSSGVEYFGPDSIQVKKEKLPKIKRIIEARNASQVKKVKPASAIDFCVPKDETFADNYLAELMQEKKRSRLRNVDKEVPEDYMNANTLPPEEIVLLEDFNSLFTRDIKEFNLEEELAQLEAGFESRSPAVARSHGDPEGAYGTTDLEAGGGPEDMPIDVDNGYDNYGDQGYDDAGDVNDAERPAQMELGDMTGMNLFTNYFNIKEDDRIVSLEKKLAQNFNFKITEFKKHVNERYIQLLESLNTVTIFLTRPSP